MSYKRRVLPFLVFCCFACFSVAACATANYQYARGEYVTITNGISPDGKYAFKAHGEGYLGYNKFHIVLTDQITGNNIGVLKAISNILDTAPSAYCVMWAKDSREAVIIYRIDRHLPIKAVLYRITREGVVLLKGPFDATDRQVAYWDRINS